MLWFAVYGVVLYFMFMCVVYVVFCITNKINQCLIQPKLNVHLLAARPIATAVCNADTTLHLVEDGAHIQLKYHAL